MVDHKGFMGYGPPHFYIGEALINTIIMKLVENPLWFLWVDAPSTQKIYFKNV
jgi:hypothetical protein